MRKKTFSFQHFPFLFRGEKKLRTFSELIYKSSDGRFCARPAIATAVLNVLIGVVSDKDEEGALDMLDYKTNHRCIDDFFKAIKMNNKDCLHCLN